MAPLGAVLCFVDLRRLSKLIPWRPGLRRRAGHDRVSLRPVQLSGYKAAGRQASLLYTHSSFLPCLSPMISNWSLQEQICLMHPLRCQSCSRPRSQGARSERCPRSDGLAARLWRFRSASSTLISGMALCVLHVGWNNSLRILRHIEPRFINVLFCSAGLFAQECKHQASLIYSKHRRLSDASSKAIEPLGKIRPARETSWGAIGPRSTPCPESTRHMPSRSPAGTSSAAHHPAAPPRGRWRRWGRRGAAGTRGPSPRRQRATRAQ